MDLLQLAGLTKSGLRELDQTRVGSSQSSDHIDLRELAGMNDQTPQGPKQPSILDGLDFIEQPVSNPIGRVDMDGSELPPLPTATPPQMIPIPEEIKESVMGHLHEGVAPKSTQIPDVSGEGFDLFQHAVLKSIIDDLTKAISAMDTSLEDLKVKREKLIQMMLGEK